MAFQVGTRVDPRLGALDFSGFTNAANIRAQAMANLGQEIGGAIQQYSINKQKKKDQEMRYKTILPYTTNLFGTDDGEKMARQFSKNPEFGSKVMQFAQMQNDQTALNRAIQSSTEVGTGKINFETVLPAFLELGGKDIAPVLELTQEAITAQTPGFTTGIDLESTGQFLLPPTEEFPAGQVVLGGFASEGPLTGNPGYFTGEGTSRRFVLFPEGTRQYSSGETDKVRNQLIDISNDLQEEQQGITALKNYYETRAGTPKGLEFLFEDISRKFSTLLGKTLTADQVKLGLRQGQFQGLLGRIRLDVLGGGVLTEQDASRLEIALGGSGVASDPAVVKEVIGDIIRGKQVKEAELINNYNRFLTIDPFVYNIFKDTVKEPIDVGNIFDPTPVNDEPKTLDEAERRAIELGQPAFKFGGKTYKTPTQ